MEKISGILAASPRVKSVDLEDAPPARPGAPAMGRKPGRNSIADRVTLSQKAKEIAGQDTMMKKNPKDAASARMVEELSRKFFETRVKPVEKEISQSEAVVENISEKTVSEPKADFSRDELDSLSEVFTQPQRKLDIEA